MKLSIRNQPDFFAGLLFIGIGVAFGGLATQYHLGTLAEMGPGFFPLILCALLTIIGAVVAFRSVTGIDEIDRIDSIGWRPLVSILAALTLFGLLLMPLGFVVATIVLVLLSASASHEFGWRYALMTTAVLIVSCYLIFIYGLGLPMPTWPGGY